MSWLRNHPYADTAFAAGVVAIVITLVVRAHLGVTPTTTSGDAWDDGGIVVRAVPVAPSARETNTPAPTNPTSYNYIPLTPNNSVGADTVTDASLDEILAQITVSRPAPTTHNTQKGTDAPGAYAFIPQGLIATTTTKTRTSAQDDLYAYGNEIGDVIQSFERNNPNQPSILKDFIENRTDTNTIAAMKKLGDDLARVGATIGNLDASVVPLPARSAHTAFIASYRDIGSKLSKIPDAQGDTALLAAIDTYNAAANVFVRKYVALVLIFQSYGVMFGPNDGGSVFTFPSASL